jgi:hypothetical protein
VKRVPPSPEWDALIARHQAELEAGVRGCGLPLVGLADPVPAAGMLGGANRSDDVVTSVSLHYGDPVRHDGPHVEVRTTRWSSPVDLRDALEAALDQAGDDSVVGGHAETTTVRLDDGHRPATLLRAGTRFWAARFTHFDCEIVVVARDVDLAATTLASVGDVEPFLRNRAAWLAAMRGVVPPSLPVPDVDDPLRALVDETMEDVRRIRERVREGRRPRHRGDSLAAALWEPATQLQMRRTGQSHDAANDAVTALINELIGLLEHAPWFADERLRAAAVDETLAYWTGADPQVPSRAAQAAWRRHWDAKQARGAGPPADVRRWFEQLQSGQQAWLDAWADWAKARGPDG